MRLPTFLPKLLIVPKHLWHWLLHSQWLGRVALIVAVLGVLVAVFSLAAAAGNNRAWTQHYNVLLWLNVGMIVCLLILVLALLGRLLLRLKKARFGAQLTLKFASSFALLGILPGVLVYCVSALFLSQSIDNWFNVAYSD
jgi:nitrogen fixation/metabolism regulation signal transduction histidine kinase